MRKAPEEGEVGPGMLYATGLVAGGSLAGIAIAMLTGFAKPALRPVSTSAASTWAKLGAGNDVLGCVMFGVLLPAPSAPSARQERLMLGRALYVAACVFVPLAWGLVAYGITRAIEKRRPATSPPKKPAMPELEYYL